MSDTMAQNLSTPRCRADAPIGVAVILLAALGAVAAYVLNSFAVLYFRSLWPALITPQKQSWTDSGMTYKPEAVPLYVTVILFALPTLALLSGIGILRGAAWGFALAIIVFSLVALGGDGVALLSLALVVYSVLRLIGAIAPSP